MASWYKSHLRRVILDMHLPSWNEDFLKDLNPREIIENFKKANCNVAIIPTKTHFGFSIYNTKVGTKHPNLKKLDYFKEFVNEALKTKMKIVAYFSVGWDELQVRENPSWVQRSLLGIPFKLFPVYGYGTYWTLLCLNSPYKDYCLLQIKEIAKNYDVDGFWIDILIYTPYACYCSFCKRKFKHENGCGIPETPNWDNSLFIEFMRWKADTMWNFLEEVKDLVKKYRPNAAITQNLPYVESMNISGQNFNLMKMVKSLSYVASEVHYDLTGNLFSSLQAKFNRALGEEVELLYTRFTSGWDWTLKPENQIIAETASAVANGSSVCIIDHVYPNGNIDKNVYEKVSKAYEEIKIKEKWLIGTKPLKFIAVNFSENTLNLYAKDVPTKYTNSIYGICRGLTETHNIYEFLIDDKFDLKDFKVLILPNSVCLSDKILSKIRNFVKGGGGLLAFYKTSLYDETGKRRENFSLSDLFGVNYEGEIENLSYIKIENRLIPIFSSQLKVLPQSKKIRAEGAIVKPYSVPRGRWVTHGYIPPAEVTDYPALVFNKYGKGRVVYIPANLGEALLKGDTDLKGLLKNSIYWISNNKPLIEIDAPSSIEVSAFYQKDSLIIHLVNFQYTGRTITSLSPDMIGMFVREGQFLLSKFQKDTPEALRLLSQNILKTFSPLWWRFAHYAVGDFIDTLPKRGVETINEILPVYNVEIRLRYNNKRINRIYLAPEEEDLNYSFKDNYLSIIVPEVKIHQMIVVE